MVYISGTLAKNQPARQSGKNQSRIIDRRNDAGLTHCKGADKTIMRGRGQYPHRHQHGKFGHIGGLPDENGRNGNQRDRDNIGVKHQRHWPVIARGNIDQNRSQRDQNACPKSEPLHRNSKLSPPLPRPPAPCPFPCRGAALSTPTKPTARRNGATRPDRFGQNKG